MQEVEKLVQQFRTKSNREALKIHSLKTIHCTPYQIKKKQSIPLAGPRKILPSSKYLNMFISRSFEHFAAFCFFGGIFDCRFRWRCFFASRNPPRRRRHVMSTFTSSPTTLRRWHSPPNLWWEPRSQVRFFLAEKCRWMRKDSKVCNVDGCDNMSGWRFAMYVDFFDYFYKWVVLCYINRIITDFFLNIFHFFCSFLAFFALWKKLKQNKTKPWKTSSLEVGCKNTVLSCQHFQIHIRW